MRRAVAGAALLLAAPLLPAPAAAAPPCVAVAGWDDRCERWVGVFDGRRGGDLDDEPVADAVVDPRAARAYAFADVRVAAERGTDAVVTAVDTGTGRVLWARALTGGRDAGDHPGALALSPDGTTVYAVATTGRTLVEGTGGPSTPEIDDGAVSTYAIDARTGRVRWAARYRGPAGGTGGGVAADARRVYVTGVEDETAVLLAYDAGTGRRLWRQALTPASETPGNPVVAAGGGLLWAVATRASGVAVAAVARVDARSGRETWRQTFAKHRPAALVAARDGGAYVAARVWDPVGTHGLGAGVVYFAPGSTVARLDASGRAVWRRDRADTVTALATDPREDRLWLAAGAGTVPVRAVVAELDPATGAGRWSVEHLDPRADLLNGALAPVPGGVALAAGATNRGTAYCLTAVTDLAGQPVWTARWSPSDTDSDGCRPAGFGRDGTGAVTVVGTAAYVPARQRAGGGSNFSDLVVLAY